MKRFISIFLVLFMLVGLVPAMSLLASAQENEAAQSEAIDRTKERVTITNGDYSLSINQTSFEVGEPILVSGTGTNSGAWIGLYSAEGASAGDSSILWQYVSSVGQGTEFDLVTNYAKKEDSSFEMPNGTLPEGEYVIRLFGDGSSNSSSVKALIHIRVGNPPSVVGEQGVLSTDKRVYAPGEAIMTSASLLYDDTWVGVYQYGSYSKSTLSWHWVRTSGDNVAYDAIGGKTLSGGIYMIRLCPHDGDGFGNEIAYTLVLVDDEYTDSYLNYLDGVTGGGGDEPDTPDPEEPTPEEPTPDDDKASTVTAVKSEHSLGVNKTKFEIGESIWVTAQGVGAKDWIGIAQRGSREGGIRWYYISKAGNNVPYDIKQASNIGGGGLSAYASIPEGLYTIYLIENDAYLKDDFTLGINISVGDIEDSENGKITVAGQPEQDESEAPSAPTGATYEMNDSTSGFAGGTVSVTMPAGETSNRAVVMYWANEGGRLDGYTSLARFKVTGETTEFILTDSMIVPKDATKLLVYSQNTSTSTLSEEFVSVELPSGSEMKDNGEIITSFFIISDIHIGKSGSAENFKKMLNEAIALNPNGTAIFIVGDMADNGTEAQFAQMMSLYQEVMDANGKDAGDYPLFLTLGNHDYPAMSDVFLKYATLPNGEHPTDTSYDFWLGGYHYIFLGSDTKSGLYANLTDETLAWLDQKLSECRDTSRPTFVFLHQPMYNTVSGSLPGEGWHGVNNEDALRAVLAKYPEVMLFNGHTHWTMDSVGNIFEGTEELPIHIFNCASVSYLWSGFNKISGENLDGSQGYYVEIYDGKVFVRGRDFITGEWISSAQYLIELPVSEGDGHSYKETVSYESGYMSEGVITYQCSLCGYVKKESAPALFTCLGYSVCEDGQNGIALGYKVNKDAIELYEKITGNTLSYGVFAAEKGRLAERDLFDENGNAVSGALLADITSYDFISFELKIVNFAEAHKDKMLAMGVYVRVTDGESTAYSYLQPDAPSEGEKYSYTSYSRVEASKKEDA